MTGHFRAEYRNGPVGSIEQRADERLETLSRTAALGRDGRRCLVRLVNLSRSGAMIAMADPLHKGDTVTLQLAEHGEIGAVVRWTHEGKAGLHFTRPLE